MYTLDNFVIFVPENIKFVIIRGLFRLVKLLIHGRKYNYL